MIDERKQKEIEYYDSKARESLESPSKIAETGDFEGFDPTILASYEFCYQWLKEHCRGKKVLDYGCGNGIHSIFLAQNGSEVVGIDLSEKSLKIARERAKQAGLRLARLAARSDSSETRRGASAKRAEVASATQAGVEGNLNFLKMDCEAMDFPDESFDIIFDGGTFSSLDLKKVFPEAARVLKRDGFLIGIETLGHNPLTNLKRKINKAAGRRTEWAVSHIFQMQDLDIAKEYFGEINVGFFHLMSLAVFPFLGFPGGKFLLKILEQGDRILLGLPFLRKYAFKIVMILSKPKHPYD